MPPPVDILEGPPSVISTCDWVAEDRWWVKEIAEILLANKTDASAKNTRGRTPLKMALEHEDPDVSDLLRRNGAKE